MDYRMLRRKYLPGCFGEARGVLNATVGNRVTTRLSLYPHGSFVLFCFFQPEPCVSCQAMLNSMSAHIGHSRPKPG